MSIHLLECAANKAIPASTKLALMAFADSADRYTHIALPGLDQVQRWSGVGRSRAQEIVAELVDAGLLTKHRAGRRGQRAEYVVFPDGCCHEHPRPPAETERLIGSGGADPVTLRESATPDPNSGLRVVRSVDDDVWVRPAGPNALIGSGQGPLGRTPSPSTTTTPPSPPNKPGGAESTGCQRPGPSPHANCRGCSTTNRQLAATERDADKARRLAATKAAQVAARETAAANRRSLRDRPEVQALVNATRRSLTRSTT